MPPPNASGPSALSPLTIDTSSSPRASVPLYPPLGAPEDLNAFVKAGRAVSFALSPRGNGFCAYERQKDASTSTSVTSAKSARVIYFAHWDKIRKEDAQLFVESYVTFDSLQRISIVQPESQGVMIDNSETVSGCWKALGYYVDNLYAHLDRLGLATDFNESRYNHYSAIASTTHLLQVLFTSETGSTASSIVGEELLLWLNTHYVAPTSDEGPEIDANEHPWLAEGFWIFLVRCVLRGIPKSAVYFVQKLSKSHPSRVLRRLMTELVPILQKHPRSKDFETESDFFTAHRRWKETLVSNYRRHVDELEDDDGNGDLEDEGEWRSGVETICAILEGDREVLYTLCAEQSWGWREALGVWGLWYDVKFTREALPSTLPVLLERLPIDTDSPDELIQSALVAYDTQSAIEGARHWDLWFATHAADVLDKLGELEDYEVRSTTGQGVRTTLLMEYAEHLYTDPSLWRITLEYLGACGPEGRAMVAEVIMRVPVDITIPHLDDSQAQKSPKGKAKAPVTPPNGDSADLDMIITDADGTGEDPASVAWAEWEEKVLKIIDVCKDYGLEDVLYSVCRSISQALIRGGFYGRAVQYSVMAKDGRGVGQIADLLLREYITKGADEFRSQVSSIPPSFLPSATGTFDPAEWNSKGGYGAASEMFASRLQFISRYAEFHNMFARGERRDAAKLLVVMLSARIVPKWWWGVIMLDAGGMLDDSEMLISQEEAYELLRHLEEIYTRADQGSGSDYLGALDRIMQGPDTSVDRPVDVESALGQLQVVRLALARYLARCSIVGSRMY